MSRRLDRDEGARRQGPPEDKLLNAMEAFSEVSKALLTEHIEDEAALRSALNLLARKKRDIIIDVTVGFGTAAEDRQRAREAIKAKELRRRKDDENPHS